MAQVLGNTVQPSSNELIGQKLLAAGVINDNELRAALQEQQKYGGKLGSILYNMRNKAPIPMLTAIAEHLNMPFANLLQEAPDVELLDANKIIQYLTIEAVPWRKIGDKIIIATPQITTEVEDWAANNFGDNYQFAFTTRRDIHRCLMYQFPSYFSKESIERLWRRTPSLSARTIITSKQRFVLLAGLVISLILLALFPLSGFLALFITLNLFCLITLLFKTILFCTGMRYRHQLWQQRHAEFQHISDSELPVYTILVPMFDEAATLPQLLDALRKIDYPRSKLDIKLVLEQDDSNTIEAAKSLQPEGMFEIIIVPPSHPRTKPKACNYALHFAKGEFVTIYDAEDKPDPQQLRKVVQLFRNSDDKLVCVQCRLNYYNRKQNLLTSLFSIEYAAWFDYMLPGLDYLQLPIPLGGTSNHIYLKRLLELGDWDPYNVTEDADLGIRMAFARYHTATIDSETLEEAPSSLWSWIKQRTRWIKGYMQTWLVHMRHPYKLYKMLGHRGFWGFQFFIGGPCLVFLGTPILVVASIYWYHISDMSNTPALQTALTISITTLLYALILHFCFAVTVIYNRKWWETAPAILLFPFYWILHSIASFRALWQLITNPHYWDKTEHGQTAYAHQTSQSCQQQLAVN